VAPEFLKNYENHLFNILMYGTIFLWRFVMNNTLDIIKKRRSVRNFKPEQIADSEIAAIIDAGMYAPSGRGDQSWHFTIVQNAELLHELSEAVKRIYASLDNPFLQSQGKSEKYHLYYHAPTAIIVSGNKDALLPQLDCAVCVQNMLLAAESLNIGSCWISGIDLLAATEEGCPILEKLNIPDGYKPYFQVALGYKKNEDLKAAPRKENLINFIR
jgi:nitroreductase